MQIKSIHIAISEVPLITPFKTALRSVAKLESILVKITTKNGLIGYGETAPTEAITGESKASILDSLRQISKTIIGLDIEHFEKSTQAVAKAIEENFSAKAAIEIALYDLKSHSKEIPLYQYLGGKQKSFKTGITISLNTVDTMVHDAKKAVSAGFNSLKIKLGNNHKEDIVRVEAINKAIGKSVSLKLDANQGWSPQESVVFLNQIIQKDISIELLEQPVARDNWEGLKYIKERTSIPIMADESVFSPEDAKKILQIGAVDIINIKLAKCGGITKALEIADICEEYGASCMIGCMMEGAISVGAAAHLASARSNIITIFDLDAPILCKSSPVMGGTLFTGADIKLSNKYGLGIEYIKGIKWIDYSNLDSFTV